MKNKIMQTPRKTGELMSAQQTQLENYPSQSSGFIPLHLGGLNLTPQAELRQASGGYRGNNFCTHQRNRRNHSFGSYARRDNAPKNKFQRPFVEVTKNYRKQQYDRETEEQTFFQYFHSSMLEDPWKELLERHDAFNRSINNKSDEEDKQKLN